MPSDATTGAEGPDEPRPGERQIHVGALARVEGEGALEVRIADDTVQDVRLRIFEPPRFFEALLRGRDFREAPDITARICGICPVAYQMSACHAMEHACGVTVDGPIRELRRLIYCGEWIESHVLHIYMLHAPDFLRRDSAIELAREHPEAVQRGLRLKKIGNQIMSVLAGREIHPINVRVGGFYRAPTKKQLAPLRDELAWARDAAWETLRWTADFDFPDYERDYDFVALRHEHEYPFNEGQIVSSRGLAIDAPAYDEHFHEEHVAHSTALHGRRADGGAYFVGPMARYSLNFDKLPSSAQQAAREVGLGPRCNNPYKSVLVRGVEVLFACEEAIRIIDEYEPPEAPAVNVEPRASVGYGATEAPRGLLYHRYRIDGDGGILDAKIVPPTSQNQPSIEQDLAEVVAQNLDLSDDELTHRCEQTIRNYDPCISCATHFLELKVERR